MIHETSQISSWTLQICSLNQAATIADKFSCVDDIVLTDGGITSAHALDAVWAEFIANGRVGVPWIYLHINHSNDEGFVNTTHACIRTHSHNTK